MRGGRPVFSGVDFMVRGGEALLLVGPNGSGKSSLLRLIAGLVDAAAGDLVLEGAGPDAELTDALHYVGHLDGVKPAMSPREMLHFWRTFLGSDPLEDDPLEAFDLVHLADLPAAYLSAGQKRRLALTRLLVAHRPVWLLDEPTVALDAENVARLAELTRAHMARGGIVIAATHLDLGLAGAGRLDMGQYELDELDESGETSC